MGFIAGANKYYEFSGHRPFEREINDLIMCLRRIKKELQPEIKEPFTPVSTDFLLTINVLCACEVDTSFITKVNAEYTVRIAA